MEILPEVFSFISGIFAVTVNTPYKNLYPPVFEYAIGFVNFPYRWCLTDEAANEVRQVSSGLETFLGPLYIIQEGSLKIDGSQAVVRQWRWDLVKPAFPGDPWIGLEWPRVWTMIVGGRRIPVISKDQSSQQKRRRRERERWNVFQYPIKLNLGYDLKWRCRNKLL